MLGLGMLNRKPGLSCMNEIRFYIFVKLNSNLFFCHFRQGSYVKITKCQVKLIHTFV